MPFFTNGDDNTSQGLWARENGMPNKPSPEDILLAQIEHHRTELRPENILLAGSAIRKCEFDSLRRGAWKFSSILAPQRLLEPSYFFPRLTP
jgi:hypothetical protein